MIRAGDKICVGVSAGKDSLTLLVALAELRRFYPKPFTLCAVTVDLGFSGADYSEIEELCRRLAVEYLVVPTEIGKVVFDIRREKNPCSLCAKMRRGALHGITLDAGSIPDLIPVVSCLAALCEGETRIENAARLRLKESDRLQTTAALISALGGSARELADGLVISGRARLSGGTADACGDHRIAMSAAMAACGCEGPVTVLGSECVAKSYPAFWEDFASLKEDAV